jgi:YVTN family beta-propeller protein
MAKRSEAMSIIAVSIVILFLISGFPVMVYGSGSEESASPSSTSGNTSNTNITPFTQDSSQNNSAGFVKYTLDLLNNTLINGNFVNTFNGISPYGVAFDSSNGDVYVTNFYSDSVSVINGATNTVIAGITVGLSPYGVAFDSSNGDVYVANEGSDSVSVTIP